MTLLLNQFSSVQGASNWGSRLPACVLMRNGFDASEESVPGTDTRRVSGRSWRQRSARDEIGRDESTGAIPRCCSGGQLPPGSIRASRQTSIKTTASQKSKDNQPGRDQQADAR
jgi:hypothetical protein